MKKVLEFERIFWKVCYKDKLIVDTTDKSSVRKCLQYRTVIVLVRSGIFIIRLSTQFCLGLGGSSKQKTKGNKKEKHLTVKPLRLQLEKANTGLKDTLGLGLEVCDVVPLDTQIAGHGSCDDGKAGMLKHKSGIVLKPIQPPP